MNSVQTSRDRPRLPKWMRRKLPPAGSFAHLIDLLDELKLETVCTAARCPSRGECFSRGTATFMISGNVCTRDCGFCAVQCGEPSPPRSDEPEAVAEAADRLKLRHVVITSVTRDDLPDGGAEQFAETISAVRSRSAGASIEVLTPDFSGDLRAVRTVLDARPDVFNHNVETVARLYPTVRPQGRYSRSLDVLAFAGKHFSRGGSKFLVKSGLMLGLGESNREIRQVLADLRHAGVNIVTMGQYLAPSAGHVPIARFVSPEEFADWRNVALEMGFLSVAAGPYVRSSYNAEALLRNASG